MSKTLIEILRERLAQETVPPPPELMEAYAPSESLSEPNLQEIISRRFGEALAALPKVQESDPFEDA